MAILITLILKFGAFHLAGWVHPFSLANLVKSGPIQSGDNFYPCRSELMLLLWEHLMTGASLFYARSPGLEGHESLHSGYSLKRLEWQHVIVRQLVPRLRSWKHINATGDDPISL